MRTQQSQPRCDTYICTLCCNGPQEQDNQWHYKHAEDCPIKAVVDTYIAVHKHCGCYATRDERDASYTYYIALADQHMLCVHPHTVTGGVLGV